MMAAEAPQPDTAQIRQHLGVLTARWHELGEPVWLEIRALNREVASPVIQRFRHDPDWLDEAAEFCAALNARKRNIYAVINPLKDGYHGSAEDTDVAAAIFQWIDCDDAAAAEAARNFAGPKHALAVVTGRTPHPRPHVYWELDEWQRDLGAWRDLQERMAATFGSDRVVVNPSRIMRLAGTVTYPDAQKRARGYVSELATLKLPPAPQTAPFERLDGLFQKQPHSAPERAAGGLHIDTGGSYAPSLDRALAAAQIKAGNGWHENMKRLVPSYVARGWTDDEIIDRCLAFTLPGYTHDDTRRDVASFIKWAREQEAKHGGKYATSPENPHIETDWSVAENREQIETAPFRPWVERDLSTIPQPQFVYSDFYARGYTSVTLAPPKVGKSLLGLAEAIDMATGRGFLTGQPRDPLRVVYFNAEDDQDVIDSRVAAILQCYGIAQSEIAGRLFATSGVDWDGFYLVGGNEPAINEKAVVSIERFIEASNADGLVFDPLQDLSRSPETNDTFRLLGQRLRRLASTYKVALGIIHHTRKMAPGIAPTMDDGRGGSALRGTARFNRILAPMTDQEAAKAGVQNHRHYFRIADAESNLAPPSAEVNKWFEKVSVETPSGAYVGAVKRWEWPDAFQGVTVQHAAMVRSEIDRMPEPPRADIRSKSWAGEIVASVIGLNLSDPADKARVKSILATWIASDVLRVTEARDPRAGREVQVIVCGANNPKNAGE